MSPPCVRRHPNSACVPGEALSAITKAAEVLDVNAFKIMVEKTHE